MDRQQQIERLIEKGIQCRLFQAITRQARPVTLLISPEEWQKAQEVGDD